MPATQWKPRLHSLVSRLEEDVYANDIIGARRSRAVRRFSRGMWRRRAAPCDGRRFGRRSECGRRYQGERRRRDVPVADLFEVVLRIQQTAAGRRDQLSVDRIRRRHPSVLGANGVLRRQRPTDDRRDAREGAGPILHFPTVLGAVVPVYNLEGVSTQLKFTGALLADIFLGKITQLERPRDREDSIPASRCRRPTSPSCTAPTARARRSSGPTTWQGLA